MVYHRCMMNWEKVSMLIKCAMFLALTTDCWTSCAGDSYITINSHCIDDKYKQQLVVLDTFPVYERHTVQNLLSKILIILKAWQVDKKKVTCFVRDNETNITAAVWEGGFAHIGCVDHTLQLYINDGLKEETITELLKTIRTTVGYFHWSSAAHRLLSNIQTITVTWASIISRMEFYFIHDTKISWTVPCNHHFSVRYNLFCRTH